MSTETAMFMQAWGAVAAPIASLAVGLAQFILILVGLRQMRTASADRNRQMEGQEKAAADQHKETMQALDNQRRALEALIGRTGGATS